MPFRHRSAQRRRRQKVQWQRGSECAYVSSCRFPSFLSSAALLAIGSVTQLFRFVRGLFVFSSLGLAGMLGFHKFLQLVQARCPENPVLLDPRVDGAEWLRVELVNAIAPFAMLTDEVSAAQETQMLGDGRTRHREGVGDLSGRLTALAEKVENGPPGRIGESLKGGFLDPGVLIRNRTVTHNM